MGHHLLFLSVMFLSAAPTALAFCPKGCRCDDMRLRVECTNSTLGERGVRSAQGISQTLFRCSANRSQHQDKVYKDELQQDQDR